MYENTEGGGDQWDWTPVRGEGGGRGGRGRRVIALTVGRWGHDRYGF